MTHALPGDARPFPVDAGLTRLVQLITAAGGRPIVVGGCVRDHLLGKEPKDIDIEVYGLSLGALESALAPATVHAVGRAFGVLKVELPGDRQVFDVALPRTESKAGRGHKGFVVESDPNLDPKTAAARRDFTVNAIGVDVVTGAFIDPHDGRADLRHGVLRHVSAAFDEDPLRVLRAAQFAARFGLALHEDTVRRCQGLRDELATLPVERIGEEMKKLLTKGVWPSAGLQILRRVGALEVLFPELFALISCPQEREWHPEGDVWVHTLLVVDECARLVRQAALEDDEALRVLLGALCHDVGKPVTTELSEGRLRSLGHDSAGEGPTRTLLARMGMPPALIDDVTALVLDHLRPYMLYRERDKVSDGAIRRLALRVPIPRLLFVARADHFGRTTPDAIARDDVACAWLLDKATALSVDAEAPKPLLLGRHLLARGLRPGPAIGTVLKAAFEAQLEGVFGDEPGALAWLDAHLAGSHP